MWGLPHYVSDCRRERETSARPVLTPCERAVVGASSSHWISEGVIDVGPSGVLFAFSDLHGDVGLFKEHLYNAGLMDRRFRWLMRHAVVVVCGDTVDDCRGATCGALEAQMGAAGFDGDPGAPHGSNEWNMLMLIRYLVAKQGARIVTLFGNHEVMRIKGQSAPYQRRVSAEYERRTGIDVWGAGSVMRTLLGEPLLMACAGNVLFLHADAPRQTTAPGGLEGLVRECNRRFRRTIEAGGVVDGDVHDALWGRRLGAHIDAAVCDELARNMPHVLVVRGHCINNGRGGSSSSSSSSVPFLMTGADKEALRRRGVATARAARVGRASGGGNGEVFDGVTLACFGRDVARPYGGAVLRVDCGASYAFGGGRAGALVCILMSNGEVGDVYCIAGARRPPLR
jgi:hypothetical protein